MDLDLMFLYYLFNLVQDIFNENFSALKGILFAAEVKMMRVCFHIGPVG
ncbi:MAG: hypothetical protein QG575_1623, partial [Euryarchaeota archaeon]|nr:hypothetical protein [Euryarchaeota archaeon]